MKSVLTGISILALLAFGCSSSNATPPDAGVDAVDAPVDAPAETMDDAPVDSGADSADSHADADAVDAASTDVPRDADIDAPLVNATITTLTPAWRSEPLELGHAGLGRCDAHLDGGRS